MAADDPNTQYRASPEGRTSPNAPFVLNLFGAFEARMEGQPLAPLRSVKGKHLLALLALRVGQEVARTWLAENLWPDSETPSDSLRQSLSDVRQKMGNQAFRLESPTKTTLRLNGDDVDIDVVAFDQAMKRGDVHSLREAVQLYRGDLLEGVTEVWALAEREARQQAYLSALETLAANAHVDGDTQAEIHYLRRALVHDPCRETAARNVMEALVKAGEPQAALEVYHQLRQRLLDDGNTLPNAETRAAYQRILKNKGSASKNGRSALPLNGNSEGNASVAPAPEWTVTSAFMAAGGNMPRALTPLIGREVLLHDIKTRLLTNPLVTLVGTGGVGKTRLATQAARELTDTFEEGIWFVDLSAVTSPAQIAQEISRLFGMQAGNEREMLQNVGNALRQRQLLLVLDNCETCLEAAATVAQELLRVCPHLRLVATSRQRLGLASEAVVSVKPLEIPNMEANTSDANRWRGLLETPSVRLFLERANAVRDTFTLTKENTPAIAEICQRLDGLPLALELAAPLLEILTPQEIVMHLEERFALLMDTAGSRPTRHQSLRAVIASSVDLLSQPERMLFRRLSVFVGGWTLDAAQCLNAEYEMPSAAQLASSPSTLNPQPSSFTVLRALVAKSLVVAEEWNGQMRFRMLESIREFACEMLAQAGETMDARVRHLKWMLQTALQAEPELTGANQVAWLERLEVETSNLRHALDWAETNADSRRNGLALANALGRYWQIRGHFAEGRTRLARLLEVTQNQQPDSLRANALNWLALLNVFIGDLENAEAACRAGLAIWHQQDVVKGSAGSLGIMGIIAANRGNYAMADRWYRQALEGARAAGDRAGEAGTLGYLGINAVNQGYYEEARTSYEASLLLRREMRDVWGIAASLNNLGQLARKNGELSLARQLLSESLTLRRQLSDRRNCGITLNVLALLAWEQNDLPNACACLLEATDLFDQLGDRRSMAYALEAWARFAATEHEPERALRWAEVAGQLRQKIGSPLHPAEQTDLQNCLYSSEAALDEADAHRAREQGKQLPLEHALAEAKTFGLTNAAKKPSLTETDLSEISS